MTALNSIQAGQRITAGMLQAVAPAGATKTVDQSVVSSTTLVNDNALALPLLANATYRVILTLKFDGGTAGSSDIKIQFTGPSGFAVLGTLTGNRGGVGINAVWTGNPGALNTGGAGVTQGALWVGTVTTGVTAGTLQLQFAQNTSSGTATFLRAGSDLTMWQTG